MLKQVATGSAGWLRKMMVDSQQFLLATYRYGFMEDIYIYIYIYIYTYIYTYIYIYYTVHHIWIISSTFVSWPHIYILDQTQSKKVTFFGSVAPLSLGCKELDGEHPRQCPWFTSRRFLGCSHFFCGPWLVNFTRKW